MAGTKRTTASRRRDVVHLSIWLFPGSAVLAYLAFYAAGATEAGVWLARLVLVAGGSLTGALASRHTSTRGLVAALLIPIPPLVVVGLLMAVAISNSDSDLGEAVSIPVLTLLLFEIPLVVAFKYQAGRRGEMAITPASSPEDRERDRELDLATDHGLATTVVREYLDDEDGRSHLETDTKRLQTRGYDVVSIAREPAPTGSEALVLLLWRVISMGRGVRDNFGSLSPQVLATFRLRSSPHAVPDHMRAPFRRSRLSGPRSRGGRA